MTINQLESFITNCNKLESSDYYQLVALFGKKVVSTVIDDYVKEKLVGDFSTDNQKMLWNRYGYYFSTLDHSIFEFLNQRQVVEGKRAGLSLLEEKRYGYHLLSRPYIQICCDENKNAVNMEMVFASIRHIEVRNFVLGQFQKMYSSISRVSNADKEMQLFLKKYSQLCEKMELPVLSYQGTILEEDMLMDQVEMYVRYSIARDKFLVNNLGLICPVADKYQSLNASYEDLYQVGYLGLLRAVDSYNICCNILFSTYATNGIQSYIRRYIRDYSKSIRIAAGLENLNCKIKKEKNLFQMKFDREPTEDELASILDVSKKRIHYVMRIFSQCNCTSLDIYIGDDQDKTLLDMVADKRDIISERVIDSNYLEYILEAMDQKLDEREKRILLARASGVTLKVLGQEMGVTIKRIDQLQRRAVQKLQRVPGIMESNPFRR